MKNIVKEVLIIFIVSAVIGWSFNAVNPTGIPLIGDANYYKFDSSKTIIDKNDIKNFKNDPFDTTLNSNPNFSSSRERTKEGFIKPLYAGLEQAKTFYDMNALFVDGRSAEDFNKGRIKGAINFPYTEFVKKSKAEKIELTKKFNKHGIIVCYCRGKDCEVSIDLAYEFAKLGFSSVNIYFEGFQDWKDAGFPVEP